MGEGGEEGARFLVLLLLIEFWCWLWCDIRPLCATRSNPNQFVDDDNGIVYTVHGHIHTDTETDIHTMSIK